MPRLKEDQIAAVIIALVLAFYLTNIYGLETLKSDDPVGPTGVPTLIAGGGMGLCAWLFFRPQATDTYGTISPRAIGYWLALLVYVLVIPYAGFGLSTVIFLAILLFMLGIGITRLLVASFVLTGAVMLLFNGALGLRLTWSPWG